MYLSYVREYLPYVNLKPNPETKLKSILCLKCNLNPKKIELLKLLNWNGNWKQEWEHEQG